MKWGLFILLLASFWTAFQLSFFNNPVDNSKQAITMIDKLIQDSPVLPRYMEGGYSPLGRSPVVDALLADPFYAPNYAEEVAETIKTKDSLFSLSTAIFSTAGIPTSSLSNDEFKQPVPEHFLKSFPPNTAKKLHGYWLSFIALQKEVEATLNPLSLDEKEWIKNNYNKFFFGEEEKGIKYDFFTSDNPYPFKFFELASKIDLAKLFDCARKLSLIADDFSHSRELFSLLILKDDFIWEENGLKLIISKKSGVTLTESADFYIDLGGHNTIQNNVGGTEGTRALALHIDLKGNNNYVGKNFVQGSGFLGVGLLYSCAGNNSYTADSYSQGSGLFGVGMLVNLEGNNRFVLNFGGQSFALFGSSILWNKKGKNEYSANQGMAQAASSTLGIAFLVDNEGGNSYQSGVPGSSGTTRFGGIGQGGSSGFRFNPWLNNPSLYGGLSFLYIGSGNNRLKTVWLGQGSAYFLGAGIIVAEGSNDLFEAEYDAQGQGLHLAFGLLLKKGNNNRFNGGWGSLGVAGDRSAGMFISIGENNHYQGTDQSIGSSRKPKALGVFINVGGKNSYSFQKISNARLEFPQTPREWSYALFIDAGNDSAYPVKVDEFKRGNNLEWGIKNHSLGISTQYLDKETLFSKFHTSPLPSSNTTFKPLPVKSPQELANELGAANYDKRRQIYETLEMMRFKDRKTSTDLNYVLKNPTQYDEDLLNYAILWALRNKDKADLTALKTALKTNAITSEYSRKMATSLVATFFSLDSIPLIIQILNEDPSEDVRYYAALSLTFHLSPETLPAIQKNLNDPSQIVRFAIAKGLQENPNPNALSLATALFKDPSFYVRRAAGLSAISLGDKSGISIVLETLKFESLDTTYNYGDNIYAQLSSYLNVDFGIEKEAWKAWWNKEQETYQLPPKEIKK